jgi:hypothetical protein
MARPLNECRDCGATWYPRGRDLSHRCRDCGSKDVRIAAVDPPPVPESAPHWTARMYQNAKGASPEKRGGRPANGMVRP